MKIEVFPVKILSDGRIVTDGARRLLPSKDKVRLRRDKIIQCMANGMTQEEISMELRCSLSTIEKDIKVFLDFGMSFGKRGAYFDEFMSPRTAAGLRDFFEMGMIPKLDGLYRNDLNVMLGEEPKPADIDAVLLTHAHADHADYISFLHEDIPIYMGDTCKLILEAIKERGQRSFEKEILSFKPRTAAGIDRRSDEIERTVNTFRTGDKFKVGSLEVEPIHVDHSVPGAYGFIIYTSSGPVVYTGDIRLHGTRPDMTEDFVKKAAEVDPIALLCEGTRITDPETDESEQKVYNDCNANIKNNDGLVIADFNFKDMDRMRTFYDIAKDNDRKFVVDINNVAYLKHLSKDPQLGIPDFSDEHIAIFKPLKSSYSKSQKDLFDEPNLITADDVMNNQDKMLCAFSFWNFGSLIDIKPTSNSLYIHSASEPWDDEGESDKKRVNLWLEHFGLNRLQSHCSGHSKGSYLLEVVKTIDSDMLYPIHTEHPDAYGKVTDKLTIVQEAKRYEL